MKPLSVNLQRDNRRRKGSIILLMAGGMTMFLGFAALAVDYGFVVNDANRLQRACDAAALAGASELRATTDMTTNKANAIKVAQEVFTENGFRSVTDSSVVSFNDATTPTKVIVNGSTTRTLFFATFRNTVVQRTATAVIRAGNGNTNVAPLGITEETYNYWNQANIKANKPLVDISYIRQNKQMFAQELDATGAPTYDPFVLFDLRSSNAKSGEHMARQLTGEEPGVSAKDDKETTLNSALISQGNKFEGAIETLMQKAAGEPWKDAWGGDWLSSYSIGIKASDLYSGLAPRSNPRVVNIVVVEPNPGEAPVNGTFNTTVKKIVPIYIEKVTSVKEGKGKDQEDVIHLFIRFLPEVSGGATTTTSPDPSEGAEGGSGYMISLES